MHASRTLQTLLAALLIAGTTSFALGCGGEDDATKPGGEEDAMVECKWDEEEIAWDQEGPGGIVPDALLEELEAEALREKLGKGPDAEELLFSVQYVREGEHALYLTATQGGCGDGFVFPGTLKIATDDGSLDEAFDVRPELDGDALKFMFSVSDEDLDGSFEPTLDDGEEFGGYSIDATIGKASADEDSGSISMLVEGSDDETAWQNSERIFSW